MELFLRAEGIKDMIAMMKLFWFAFIWVIFSWKVSNQTLVASDVLDVILIATCWLFEQLWDSIATNSGHKWMFGKFRKRDSLILVNNKAFSDKILEVFREVFQERNVVFHDFDFELFFGGTVPRYFSMDHFINYDAHGPNVVFDRVDVWSQSLWTHVQRWPDVDGLFGVGSYSFSKSKICDFSDFVLDEQVGRFEVSVQKSSIPKMLKAFDKVADDGNGFFFG